MFYAKEIKLICFFNKILIGNVVFCFLKKKLYLYKFFCSEFSIHIV